MSILWVVLHLLMLDEPGNFIKTPKDFLDKGIPKNNPDTTLAYWSHFRIPKSPQISL
jgi:hypothetical protein